MSSPAYRLPVAALLTIGPSDARAAKAWADYPAIYALEAGDAPELIRMAIDPALHLDEDGHLNWAPVHAWRALGQLGSPEAVAPLLQFLSTNESDDTAWDDIPTILGMIGAPAIPELTKTLAAGPSDAMHRVAAAEALAAIAALHPAHRDACIEQLTDLLASSAMHSDQLAGYAVSALVDLQATEMIAAIRDASARNAFDISIPGDLEDIEIALGLRTTRATPKPHYVSALIGHPEDEDEDWKPQAPFVREGPKVGRNDPCPCGSGKKHKKCCLVA